MPPGPDHPEDITGYGVGKRHLMAMHLDQPIGTLTPAQVAAEVDHDADRLHGVALRDRWADALRFVRRITSFAR